MSHPSRVRGLKPEFTVDPLGFSQSHPSRVRGLNRINPSVVEYFRCVAPLTGAWIETCIR